MADPDVARQSTSHETSSEISRGIVQLYSTLYGRGPDRARTHVAESYVLTLLYGCFTAAEHTLLEAGRTKQVEETRRAFQEAVRDDFVRVVEEATGREVETFLSQTEVDSNVSIEVFLLKVDEAAASK